MRSISRVADVSINTVAKLLVDAGKRARPSTMRRSGDVKARRVQVRRNLVLTATRSKRTSPAMKEPAGGAGDTWTWTAIDADTKLTDYVAGRRPGQRIRHRLHG